jgi:hypothetical protein
MCLGERDQHRSVTGSAGIKSRSSKRHTYNGVSPSGRRQPKGRWSCGQVVSGGGSVPLVR